MNKEFIPYEQALELKELGYSEYSNFEVTSFYQKIKDNNLEGMRFLNSNPIFISQGVWLRGTVGEEPRISEIAFKEEHIDCVLAPLYQQAFRWFREKHDLCSHIRMFNGKFTFEINEVEFMLQEKDTHKEAELACLKKLIEIVKENK